jgi:uncharacterized protein (TIGR02271 family)
VLKENANMNAAIAEIVIFEDGSRGLLVSSLLTAPADGMAEVVLDSGQHLFVPLDTLVPMEEGGGYRAAVQPSGTQADQEDTQIIPLVAETLTVGKREVETGRVRFRTTVTERTETVDEPLLRTEVQTRRVEINRFVDSPPPVRYEGDAMIIPILEEVLVVEKRLRLKEEVYITQVQTEHREPQTVILRQETLSEERLPANNEVTI